MCSMTSFDLPYEGDPAHSQMSDSSFGDFWCHYYHLANFGVQ
jgi:hypothetical protein